jgi:AcrR family transcriptional regulator
VAFFETARERFELASKPANTVKSDPRELLEIQPRLSKGERTRRRIMDATATLLRTRPFGEMRITEVAKAAKTAQPNFYVYFPSLEAVVLALAQELSIESLAKFVDEDWNDDTGLELARKLSSEAIAYWRRNGPIYAIVNFMADERHADFGVIRARVTRKLYKGFEAKIRKAQAEGWISGSIQPRLAGYQCVAILASAGMRYDLFRASGFSHAQIVETNAQIVHRLLGMS